MDKQKIRAAADDVRKYADMLRKAVDVAAALPGMPAVMKIAKGPVDTVDAVIDLADDEIDREIPAS